MINEKYQLWCEKAIADPELITELKAIAGGRGCNIRRIL